MTLFYTTNFGYEAQSKEGADSTDEMPKVVEHFLDNLVDVLVRLAQNDSRLINNRMTESSEGGTNTNE